MSTEVGFYHCTRAPVLEVAARLAAKAYGSGARMLLLAAEPALQQLDKLLWTADPDSFLPHAISGVLDDAAQPLLLAPLGNEALVAPANGARYLLLVDTGLPAGFTAFERVFHLFEDGGPAHQRARDDWKALADREDVARSYWQQGETGWTKREL